MTTQEQIVEILKNRRIKIPYADSDLVSWEDNKDGTILVQIDGVIIIEGVTT